MTERSAEKKPLLKEIEEILIDAFARRPSFSSTRLAEMTASRILETVTNASLSTPSRTSAAYLRLIRQILESTRSGVSRDEFLSKLFFEMNRPSTMHRSIFILEGYFDPHSKVIEELDAPYFATAYPERVGEFRNAMSKAGHSRFIQGLLALRNGLDFDLRSRLNDFLGEDRYEGEFTSLDPTEDAWFCSLPLPASERGEPERAMVAIYSFANFEGVSRIPPGASQEWDILKLVPEIFVLLQHRVRNLREQIAEGQKRMIADLAPTAITHELGTGLSLVEQSLSQLPAHLRPIRNKIAWDDPDFIEVAKELQHIRRQILNAKRTTSAFTNLERRNPRSKVGLLTLLKEIETVLSRRLSRAGIIVIYDVSLNLEIETDARFVNHIVMNVMMNAIEAIEPLIEEAKKEAYAELPTHYIALEAVQNGDTVDLIIANDGPRIPAAIAARAFERGVTSKPLGVGHGQGLHLCREIARHLGGAFGFGPNPENFPQAIVSFYLSIPRVAKFEGDS